MSGIIQIFSLHLNQMAAAVINSTYFKNEGLILKLDDKTGETTLSKQVGPRGALKEVVVYKNGTWLNVPEGVTDSAKQKEGHNQVISTLKGISSKNPKVILPEFAKKNEPSKTQGEGGTQTAPQEGIPIEFETLIDKIIPGRFADLFKNLVLNPDLNLENYDGNLESVLGKSDEPLKYPVDILNNGQDILVITQYRYKSPYNEVFNNKGAVNREIYQSGTQRLSALRKKKIKSLYLPIPNNASDSNSVGWGDDRMGSIAMGAVGDLPGQIKALLAGSIADRFKAIPGKGGDIAKSISQNPELVYSILSGNFNNPSLKQAIQAAILQKFGFDISAETILSRGYGVIPNSNLELLFNGPTLRGFGFGYIMSPRSEKEAAECRKILRFFKQGMAPKKKDPKGGFGGASFFLATPNVFKLEYKTWEGGKLVPIRGLNRFKICALTNLQTSYSEGMWAAYDKGQPARMQMNLTFKELEPVYESDYQDNAIPLLKNLKNDGAGFQDTDGISVDDIGY